ncbi:hypothetical protein ACFL1S_05620 [Pseudomonadota bacterium]
MLCILSAQERIGEWKSYTSPLDIRGMVESGDSVIAATGGGLLIFNRRDGKFSTLTNTDGLVSTDLRSVALDEANNIWLGGGEPDGIIQIYDPVRHVSVNDFDFGFFEITGIATSDSMVFAIFRENQDLGLVEFIYQDDQFIYRDIYRNWPDDIRHIETVALVGDHIWIGTDRGLYSGNWRTDNLKDRENWFRFAEGNVTTMHQYGSDILYVLDRVVYHLDGLNSSIKWQWNHFANTHLFTDIISAPDGNYWGLLNKTLIKLANVAKDWQFDAPFRMKNLISLEDNTLIAGTAAGLAIVDTSARVMERFIPNAPVTNQFSAVTVLSDGRIVAASNRGLSIRDGNGWRNIIEDINITSVESAHDYSYFTADTLPIDFGGFVADLEQGPDGLLYCAIRGTTPVPNANYNLRGGGIIIIDIDDPLNYTLVDTAVLDYYSNQYMVVKDLEFDPLGNLWVADTYVTTKLIPLHVRSAAGLWGHFSVAASNNSIGLGPDAIAFDQWGRVWIGSLTLSDYPSGITNGGLSVLDYSGDPTAPEAAQWSLDFDGENIWSLDIDRRNSVYILTPSGLANLVIQNSMASPVVSRSRNYFPNISFGEGSRVKIDPRGNAWTISPEQGVHILLENATYWPTIEGFRYENSDLLSDNTTDLEFDPDKGLAYIVSKRGLNTLKIPFTSGSNAATSLKLFPSPFHIPTDKPLIIDGLQDGSSIKIMTVSGHVVRTIKSDQREIQNYQAQWDGRDESGKFVGSGVYLVAAFSGIDSKVSKITVIRD